jgi:uncharacterized membrane protein (DUF485 family)
VNSKTQPAELATAAIRPQWDRIAEFPEFKTLLVEKRAFLVRASAIFLAYYFAFMIAVAYFPEVVSRQIFGVVNLANLFAVSQFAAGWLIAWMYFRAARRFDAAAKEMLAKHQAANERPLL